MNETRTFTIYGASDDLVETSGVPGCDEFPVRHDKGEAGYAGSFVLSGPDGAAMRIRAFYDGCWYFAPSQVNEDVPFPTWPMRIHTDEPGRGYSTVIEMEVPKGTYLLREANDE